MLIFDVCNVFNRGLMGFIGSRLAEISDICSNHGVVFVHLSIMDNENINFILCPAFFFLFL